MTLRDRFGNVQPLSLFWAADDGAGSGGGSDADDGDDDDSEGTRSHDADTGGKSGGTGESYYASFRDKDSFNQRMDREARSRLERDAKAAGFKDYAEQQAALKAFKKKQDDEKSELELERQNREAAEQRAQSAEERLRRASVRATAVEIAGTLDVKPERIKNLVKLAKDDLEGVDLNDDGEADEKAIKRILTAALEDSPEWKRGSGNGTTAQRGGGEFNGSNGGVSKESATMNTLIRRQAGRDV